MTDAQTAEKAPKREIKRGRIPVAVVAFIRFKDAERAIAEVAADFHTTVGKISDIRKMRNFGYVDETWLPSAEQKQAALDWFDSIDEGFNDALKAAMNYVKDLATVEVAAPTRGKKGAGEAAQPTENSDELEDLVG